jgi:hypothetical protein
MPPKIADKPLEKSPDKVSEKAVAPPRPANSGRRQRELGRAISSITKQYGDGSIMRLGDASAT